MNAHTLLRKRQGHDAGRVTMVELFFDLVFVFAITQLSHTLLEEFSVYGSLRTLLLFFAVWWVWIYTAWVTNWLDPEKSPVRLMLFALMLAGLLLSSSLPRAFGTGGLVFAGAYVAMQVGRTLFMLWVLRGERDDLRRNFERIAIWLIASGLLWISGGLTGGDHRVWLWILALAIEYTAPAVYFAVPGLGRSSSRDWDVDGSHIAERCALFVIIALGESILTTGATFSTHEWTHTTLATFVLAFLGSVAMWWIYFDTGARRASQSIERSGDPGRQGRSAYTYVHLPIVAGIVVCAVADEILLLHPEHLQRADIAMVLGGPALYLVGNALFKWITNDRRRPPLSHCAGLLALAVVAPFASGVSAVGLGALATAALVLVATWETLALRTAARVPD